MVGPSMSLMDPRPRVLADDALGSGLIDLAVGTGKA
jgi:hypothetical protein